MMNFFEGMTVARVKAFHPHDGSCDCELLFDGSRLTAVPVLSRMMSSSSGASEYHEPEGIKWGEPSPGTRDIMAVLGNVNGNPVVVGFLPQQVSQMLFDRKNFKVDRHASDVYSTIDKDGNLEVAHPSGTFLRVATSPAHEDLTGQDFDKLWAVTRNTDKPVWLSVQVANAGGVKASLTIDPSGNVALSHTGNLTVDTGGAVSVTAGGAMNLTSGGPMTLSAPRIDLN